MVERFLLPKSKNKKGLHGFPRGKIAQASLLSSYFS
jgi:hypothetical protein